VGLGCIHGTILADPCLPTAFSCRFYTWHSILQDAVAIPIVGMYDLHPSRLIQILCGHTEVFHYARADVIDMACWTSIEPPKLQTQSRQVRFGREAGKSPSLTSG